MYTETLHKGQGCKTRQFAQEMLVAYCVLGCSGYQGACGEQEQPRPGSLETAVAGESQVHNTAIISARRKHDARSRRQGHAEPLRTGQSGQATPRRQVTGDLSEDQELAVQNPGKGCPGRRAVLYKGPAAGASLRQVNIARVEGTDVFQEGARARSHRALQVTGRGFTGRVVGRNSKALLRKVMCWLVSKGLPGQGK